ncbi:GNAT family N-acetyltransferase [Pseudoduganella chitinolytica]|uniref:GNAT family N-acetyltransferase n=1 Tax=Pseudoduganella chitinolytica TaxID=34070 RepID=A0ABY8BG83_9BURK|nr:GNAT family N-acetyltransferase [Pseudoduganella chitinolytica]WEF34358.1 GNAT family N-acetyltransferase [Pseudoduganella chitinolytica]
MNDPRAPLAFVAGTAVPERDLDHMAALLFETSYLEYCSAGNRLGLPLRALQRRQNIDPWLRQIRALYVGGRFAGFYNAATLGQYAATPAVNHYRAEVQAMDAAYDAFVAAHAAPDQLFVASLAIEPAWRGRGLLDVLLADAEAVARGAGCTALGLTVWGTSAALPLYRRRGFATAGTFDGARDLFFDRLHFMVRPLPTEAP